MFCLSFVIFAPLTNATLKKTKPKTNKNKPPQKYGLGRRPQAVAPPSHPSHSHLPHSHTPARCKTPPPNKNNTHHFFSRSTLRERPRSRRSSTHPLVSLSLSPSLPLPLCNVKSRTRNANDNPLQQSPNSLSLSLLISADNHKKRPSPRQIIAKTPDVFRETREVEGGLSDW